MHSISMQDKWTGMTCWLLVSLSVTITLTAGWDRWTSSLPLPEFTNVRMKVYPSRNSTVISVNFLGPERPHVQWYMDGAPVPTLNANYYTLSSWEMGGFTLLSTSDMGKACSVCLYNTVAKTCLHLRPWMVEGETEEELRLPWPFVVPAPVARHERGETTRLFMYSLDTQLSYTYSALFIAHQPASPVPPLLLAQTRDMNGGRADDLVTMKAVTSGSEGWMVRVRTDREEMEGALMLRTAFNIQSELVESCVATRPFSLYGKEFSGPYPPGFVAMVTGDFMHPVRACMGTYCLVTCPFVSNGDVTVAIARKLDGGGRRELPLVSLVADVWRLGDYYGEARFALTSVADDVATYICDVTAASSGQTASMEVEVVRG